MTLLDQHLQLFSAFIEKELGIVYSPDNYFQLKQRLERIRVLLGIPSLEALHQQAMNQGIHGDFKQLLLDVATNNETSFFRDPKVFKVIEEVVFPGFPVVHPGAEKFRIWSAASSSGQEPYSLSILIDEYLKKNPTVQPIEVVATDISEQILKRAKDGIYSQLEVQRGLSTLRLLEYFRQKDEAKWEVIPRIRNSVEFRKQNLLEPFAGLMHFDLILCRYVLIYQNDERKKNILSRLAQSLVPKGILVLGGSESLLGYSDLFDPIAKDGAVIYQKRS